MPRRARRRSARPRTRWLAIIPDSRNFTTNGTYAVDELAMTDAVAAVPMSDLIGGTILKVFLQVEYDVTYTANNSSIGFFTLHSGIFLTEATDPETAIWTPNSPHGDFMVRNTAGARVIQGNEAADANSIQEVWGGSPGLNGHQHFMETNVRRRIIENSKLFISWFYFEGTPVTETDAGWTGRVLVQLP